MWGRGRMLQAHISHVRVNPTTLNCTKIDPSPLRGPSFKSTTYINNLFIYDILLGLRVGAQRWCKLEVEWNGMAIDSCYRI